LKILFGYEIVVLFIVSFYGKSESSNIFEMFARRFLQDSTLGISLSFSHAINGTSLFQSKKFKSGMPSASVVYHISSRISHVIIFLKMVPFTIGSFLIFNSHLKHQLHDLQFTTISVNSVPFVNLRFTHPIRRLHKLHL